MKITGAAAAGPIRSSAKVASGGFAPSEAGGASNAVAAGRGSATAGLGSLDALLALQETGGPLERRRRAVRRADRLLDGLDGLRLALIDGEPSATTLETLRRVGREQRDGTDDPGLEALLDQVDLRAAVELAKLERRAA